MNASRKKIRTLRWWAGSLIVISALLFFTPASWFHPTVEVAQIAVPLHDAASLIAESVSLHRQEKNEQDRAGEGFEHREAALYIRIVELEEQVRELSATRFWRTDQESAALQGRLIPARVLAPDIHAWRDSLLISVGSTHGVARGDAATSAHFFVEGGERQGVHEGLVVVQSEVLIGVVDRSATHSSRVRLLSDVGLETPVRLIRKTSTGLVVVEGTYWAVGRGGGRLEVRDVNQRDVEAGVVRAGDKVIASSAHIGLPSALVIGEIERLEPDSGNPLLAKGVVKCAVSATALTRVYIFDQAPDPADTSGE